MDVPSIGGAETQHRSNVLPNRTMRQNSRDPREYGGAKSVVVSENKKICN